MRRTRFAFALLLVAAATGPGCRKIEPPAGAPPIGLRESIPTDAGELIGVTAAHPDFPGWAHLWYQRPDRSLVVVTVNGVDGGVSDRIVTIPRR